MKIGKLEVKTPLLKQLKEIPFAICVLLISGILVPFVGNIEYWINETARGEGAMAETFLLNVPLLSVLVYKLFSFTLMYTFIRAFVWIGFRSIHEGLEEILNGKFKDLPLWVRAFCSILLFVGLLYALILCPPSL